MTEIQLAPDPSAAQSALAVHKVRRDLNPYWTYLARMNTAEARRSMKGCLDRLAVILIPAAVVPPDYGEMIPWHAIGYGDASGIRGTFADQVEAGALSPSHANKHLVALRGVIKEAWRHGYITADDRDRVSSITNIANERLPAGREISAEETAAMLAACDDGSIIGVRDAGIIAALHSTGGRRAEVADMLIENYQRTRRAVKFTGKGRKEREGYFHPVAAAYVDRWLALVGDRRGPIFRGIHKSGVIFQTALAPRSVGRVVDNRRVMADLAPLSTHDYRRTFIGDYLSAGGDLAQAQALAGHKSPETTAQYDRRPGDLRRAVVDTFVLPAPRAFTTEQGGSDE